MKALRYTAAGALAVISICVTVLLVDYCIARYRAPRDDKRIVDLQEHVKANASLAPKLAEEQKRISDAIRARKARIKWIAWILIAAGAAFLGAAKQLPETQAKLPEPPSELVQISAAKPRPRARTVVAQAIDLSVVDEIVAREGRGIEAAIPILQAIQRHYRYLPDEALQRVCELTEIPPAQVAGTSTFYAQFRRTPVGEHVIKVCHGTACHVSGARQITEELRRSLGIEEGSDTDPARKFTIDEVACLGCCSLAPVMMVDNHTVGKLTPSAARDALYMVEPREPA